MNLLKRPIHKSSDLLDFRKYQYSLISELIGVCFEYASRFGLKYKTINIEILSDDAYFSQAHYAFDKLRIKLDDNTNNFLELDIPTLIDDCFFKLKGVYYVPLIYILDEPITFKKNSIKINSLFKPITLYTQDNRMIIDGNNIPISRFLRLYESDENTIKEVCSLFKTQYICESQDESIAKIAKLINSADDLDEIKQFIENIFFDKWTKGLYTAYYKKENMTMLDIFEIIMKRCYLEEPIEFNNLEHKRLVFIELLLDPLFKAINQLVINLKRDKVYNQINLKSNAIIQHFYASGNMGVGLQKKNKGLSGNNLYSVVNGFSGLLSLKGSFENPKSQSELPRSISNIHHNYKGKICPVTISNKSPGVVSSLVPDQKIDLRYGLLL